MPKLYKEIIALICVGLLIIFVWVVTATPTNTPIVWVVRATPEPPFTPTITVAPTYTRVPTKTPPTATPKSEPTPNYDNSLLRVWLVNNVMDVPWRCDVYETYEILVEGIIHAEHCEIGSDKSLETAKASKYFGTAILQIDADGPVIELKMSISSGSDRAKYLDCWVTKLQSFDDSLCTTTLDKIKALQEVHNLFTRHINWVKTLTDPNYNPFDFLKEKTPSR